MSILSVAATSPSGLVCLLPMPGKYYIFDTYKHFDISQVVVSPLASNF